MADKDTIIYRVVASFLKIETEQDPVWDDIRSQYQAYCLRCRHPSKQPMFMGDLPEAMRNSEAAVEFAGAEIAERMDQLKDQEVKEENEEDLDEGTDGVEETNTPSEEPPAIDSNTTVEEDLDEDEEEPTEEDEEDLDETEEDETEEDEEDEDEGEDEELTESEEELLAEMEEEEAKK